MALTMIQTDPINRCGIFPPFVASTRRTYVRYVYLVMYAMKSSRSFREFPPSATEARTASPSSLARCRTALPLSDSIASSMTFWISCAGTTSLCFSQGLTRKPALRYLHRSSESHGWSECIGQASTGLPWLRLSMVEFQPQWLMKAAVAPCARISSCGAHPVTTTPTPSELGVPALAGLDENVGAVGVAQHPDEALLAALEGRGELGDLLGAEARRRAERDVKHGRRRLAIEPLEAPVPRLARRRPGVRVEQRVQRPDPEEPLSLELRVRGEDVDELAFQRAARVHDHAGDGRALLLLLHLDEEIHELLGHADVGGEELEAVVSQQRVPRVQPPDVVRDGDALQAEGLAVAEPRGLGGGEGVEAVEDDHHAAVGGGEAAEERRERGARGGGEGLEHGHEVVRERRRRGGVRRRGVVLSDVEVVELDGAERAGVPAVHARARLADVRRRRRVVHEEAPRREQQRQVQQLVQVALRRERHRHHGDPFGGVNRHIELPKSRRTCASKPGALQFLGN
ncbi:hypothetical protein U9M48_033529 [Paspalum notatum var. saurae]|uniref:Uncharacterized protein n=1 Tax=Paspalum notatum var. saurae TaxID=547442 RepID=A0AAQ3U8K2_PASNO